MYTDQRTHVSGPPRSVRLARVGTPGLSAISKAPEEAGRERVVVVAGRESLRIIRASSPSSASQPQQSTRSSVADTSSSSILPGQIGPSQKSTTSRTGYRLDASRNLWDGSGLKVDSALTDVGWGVGAFSNKILTSSRNGELVMWDLHKPGSSKVERRTKDHIRSIHQLSISSIVHYYCVTGGADGDVRVWDLRDLSRSLMKIHHPISVRSVVFSTSLSTPLQIGVGLDNGSVYRWDLQKGPIRHMDRLPIAHTGPILALDWSSAASSTKSRARDDGSVGHGDDGGGMGGGMGVTGAGVSGVGGGAGLSSAGWIVSAGLDRTVKIWDASLSHIPHKPTYTLHPSFPVRRVLWRPEYECELALVSNEDFGSGSGSGGEVSAGGGAGASPDFTDMGGIVGRGSDSGLGSLGGKGKGFSGDAVEIWDVRRGWIAKWAVGGSAIEGGVADIAFADSHTIWAQHPSGTFSQLDIRQSSRPIDAIPRTCVSWEAGGGLAFVSGRKSPWEVPFDDVHPDHRQAFEVRKRGSKLKHLGDPPAIPASQNFGTFVRESSTRDFEAFVKLARGYVFQGTDRKTVCTINAETAYQAGKHQAAQAWLLMGSLLTDIIPPPTPPASPQLQSASTGLSHSVSAPAAIPEISSASQPVADSTGRSSSAGPAFANGNTLATHSNGSPSRPNSRLVTPSSSNPSSPHRGTVGLPPVTPAPRRLSVSLHRRGSTVGSDQPPSRRMSSYSRPSIPTSKSESPNHDSHRHVGEGALDDSDSSDSDKEQKENKVDGGSSDEESGLRPLISPYQPTRVVPTTPSPLSHVAVQQQWSEDEEGGNEDNEASPSPGSTESSSSSEGNAQRKKRKYSRARRHSHAKSRSRSSTVASLAASSLVQVRKPLVQQGSKGSIRTVIAGDVSVGEPDSREETVMDVSAKDKPAFSPESQKRQRSQAVSSDMGSNAPEDVEVMVLEAPEQRKKMGEKSRLRVVAEETKFREIGWDTLRDALRRFADEGDVQMCSMLATVAPQELKIEKRRVARFLESYIDILTHLQLYTSAAYVRKYSEIEDVRAITRLETTIYTSCGRCRKAMVIPPTSLKSTSHKGRYSYCRSCQQSIQCSICHLPVRTLLLQCSVCAHGGHQECYRRYYMERPMVEVDIPSESSSNENRGGSAVSPLLSGNEQDDDNTLVVDNGPGATKTAGLSQTSKFSGHPCATGCGHFCWAATGMPSGNVN
ncbi:hypothetical protein PILCRDRAFT_711720 [Piloderma croceum F 1598]|uniref:Uncharacterized protein n=1 Tax=Piloderma croceum (strain F 1598) TaxID=765440 RepID=A0A0C3F2S7_PILCF|nr:hypothetical protein PILCRDRAFT_711720 [Piloderma croceum F 1598]